MSRSDVIPIDSRSHLEVADRKHRYAKNLRTYFKEYHRINGLSDIVERSAPNNENATPSRKWTRYEPFFEWLDKEESAPNLPDCPRTVLDEDRVEYLTTQAEREPYEITINGTGLGSSDADGTAGEKLWRMTQTGEPVNTGSKGWIFVLLNGRLYACEKRTNTFPRFHHSSFFAGASVSAAGMLVCVNGKLTKLFPHSGHYRPLDRHLYSLLAFLRDKGVDLSAVQVDVQRVMKLSRAQDKDGGKAKKTDSAFYLDGETAYHFLKSKTGFQECGALRHINKRRLDYTEGEESAPVKAKTAHVLTVTSPTIAADGPIEGRTPLSPVETEDALGQLPVLQKADSGDGPPHSPSERSGKLRLSIAPSSASNRSSLNMNRLSLSSTGGYASTVGSTSPFCSPIAQHNLYPLHGSSSGGGGGEGRREQESVDTAGDHRLTSSSNDSAGGGFDPSRTINDSFSQSHSDKNNNNNNNNNNSAYNTSSKGLFGSTSGDEYSSIEALLGNITKNTHIQQHQEQQQQQQQPLQDLFGSGGRSSADARARLLNTMLYADPAGAVSNPTGLVGSTTTVGRNKESSTSLPLPPSPPVPVPTSAVRTISSSNNNNNSSNSNGSAVYVQTTVATPALKIPVAAPIKKVTSYSSISSSYGSSSFAQPQPFYGNRSRSTSKAEHDLDYDLRMLLGESPIVPAPDVNYFNNDVSAASPVNALTGNGYSQYNINTNSNSTCNSRGRSRGSSYNPPYIPSATTTTNNNNSSSNALASVGYNLHNSVSNNSIAGSGSGSGHNTRSNSLYGGTTGTNGNAGNGNTNALKDPSSSEQHSPVVDKHSPRSSIGSTSVGVAAAAGNTALSNNSNKANNNMNSAEKKVDPSTGAWSPPSGKGGIGMNAGEREEKSSSSRSASARLFSEDISIPAGASIASVPVYGSGKSNHFSPATPSSEKLTAGGAERTEGTEGLSPPAAGEEGLYAGSPQPSFASSLSSTDSLPNMMLNYVMSPGGTTLHRYFDGQGEGDGMYEAEVLGDSYHDHLYGDNVNEA